MSYDGAAPRARAAVARCFPGRRLLRSCPRGLVREVGRWWPRLGTVVGLHADVTVAWLLVKSINWSHGADPSASPERQEEDHRAFENCQRQMQFLRLAQTTEGLIGTCFTRRVVAPRPAKNWPDYLERAHGKFDWRVLCCEAAAGAAVEPWLEWSTAWSPACWCGPRQGAGREHRLVSLASFRSLGSHSPRDGAQKSQHSKVYTPSEYPNCSVLFAPWWAALCGAAALEVLSAVARGAPKPTSRLLLASEQSAGAALGILDSACALEVVSAALCCSDSPACTAREL